MFDLAATDGSVRKKPYDSPIPAGSAPGKAASTSELDGAKNVHLHHILMDLYTREIDRQHDNRMEMANDEDFYDNEQWSEEDKATLEGRGQMALVYNVISASVDWIIGTEKRTRTDYKVLPRRKEDSKPAERKSQLMKYLSDVNRTPFHVSRAFEDSVKVGIGWLEDGIQDEDEDEPLYSRYENWRNILWDSAATELDLSDARYVFRSKWVDLDVSCAIFKNRKQLLRLSTADSDSYQSLDLYGDEAMDSHELALEQAGQSRPSDHITGYQRQRVRLIEAWIRVPTEVDKHVGGPFAGEMHDEKSPGHMAAIESGQAVLKKKPMMRMHVAIFTTAGMLWSSPSPYRHNRFPFTPIWAYRRGRDGMPYGAIRRLKGMQEDINKRASKALHILSTNKTIMEEGALADDMTIEEYIEEIARPDPVIVVNTGKKLEINVERELSQWHLEMMSRSISMVQQAAGVTDDNLGRQTNAKSGVAIQKRQDQGSLVTSKLFDNHRFASQVRGEKLLANIEQFMSAAKQFRITNQRGRPEYIEVNDGLPENDIVRSKADFIISESDWNATLRAAAASELLEVMSTLPGDVALVLLDLVVENMDLSNREEIVKRLRSVTGQRDPDAEEPTEEELAAAAAKAEADQINKDTAIATLKKLVAEAALKDAQATNTAAKTVNDKVGAQRSALDAAALALATPATTHVADHILAESGHVSTSDERAAMDAAMQEAAAAQPGLGMPPPVNPAPMAMQPGL